MAPQSNRELLTQIHELIHACFDLEEFRNLCFQLGVSYDDLRGETLYARMRELVYA